MTSLPLTGVRLSYMIYFIVITVVHATVLPQHMDIQITVGLCNQEMKFT